MEMLVKIHVYTDTIALSTVTKLKIRKKKNIAMFPNRAFEA